VNSQYHHEEIIKAIESIEGVRYFLAGTAEPDYINHLKSLPAWDRVDFLGQIPHSEVKNIYSKSIAGMALNFAKQVETQGTLGNVKLFEFMEAKLPVICTNYRLWKEVVEGNNCGICVDPKNIKEIENAIRYIIDNPEEAEIMGENGRKAVLEKYNWGTQERVLLKLYQGL
jgi:glycosyltransferase involved in cell wall biosynthesis